MNAADRFFAKVAPATDGSGCLVWIAALSSEGYGRFYDGGRLYQAHRWLLERARDEPIPADLDIDHLCRNRACVRPSHLEIVTRTVNLLRSPLVGKAGTKRTHCPHGHPYDEANTYWYRGHRHCKACATARRKATPLAVKAAYARAYRARKRAAA